jgi:hypothetical protein
MSDFERQPGTATHSENNLSIFHVEMLRDRKRHQTVQIFILGNCEKMKGGMPSRDSEETQVLIP